MHPDLQIKYLAFAAKMGEAGIPFGLTCVIRTRAEQEAFFAQGRETLPEVNAKRMTAGMTALRDESENYVVTQTLNSRHFPDSQGKSRAFDIVVLRGNKTPCWDVKFDGDGDSVPDYIEAAEIGRRCGLEAGAFWQGFRDYPHYQLEDVKAILNS